MYVGPEHAYQIAAKSCCTNLFLFTPVHRPLLLLQSCQRFYNACETGLSPVHTLQTLSLLQGCPV